MRGWYRGDTGSPRGGGASCGGMLQMEKSRGVRPGGGTMYPGISPMEVLRLVTPLEEEVSPYPGAYSTIWLQDVGGAC